jgi:hypothetical protein
MGRRRLAWGSWIVALAIALIAASAAFASFESPSSSDTSQKFTPPPDPTNPQRQDTPNDPKYDQAEPDTQQPADKRSTNIYDERFDLFGFPSSRSPSALYLEGPNTGKPQVSGYNAAGAWKKTIGDPRVTIAILDTGIKWDNKGLRTRIHLNQGELPKPQGCADYDCHGNDGFNVDDYVGDSRVTPTGEGGKITAEDLITAFGHDGTDEDHNGYVDDIAGWDFFDNDNNPLDQSSYFAAKNHGTGRAGDAAEQGNDGDGSIGVCPRCQIMPLRIWDTFVSDGNSFAQGILYATDNGAKVIEGANGSLYHSAFAERASSYAYDHGVVQTFSGDDLNTANHNYPANYGHAMLIEGTVPDSVGLGQNCSGNAQFCSFFASLGLSTNVPLGTYFRNANTTQFGGKSSISMEGPTGSINTGRASGGAGLVISAGLAAGFTLSPDEVRTILEQTAEDVTQGNTAGTGTPDPANPGWDSHFGWGRANLGAAVSAASNAARIPFTAAIDSPDWYAPLTGSALDVKGLASAPRAGHHFHYKLEWGAGQAPTSWHTIADADHTGAITSLGSIDLNAVRTELASFTVPADPGGPVFSPTSPNPFQHEFTVRLTVTDPTTPTRVPGVDRRVFNALDPAAEGMRAGFPKRLGTGGEAPVRYADLNGDNLQELVVPTMDGLVHAYEPNGAELPGWPVQTQIQASATGHSAAPGVAELSASGAPPREPPRAPAIADIDGDGKPEVIATAGTHLYVWEGDGSQHAGFPISSNLSFCGPAFEHQTDKHLKCGFLASPSVADLDGDGKRTDIVVASLDGHLYAFKPDGGDVAHFPVQLVDPGQNPKVLAESINQVAVGPLDGVAGDDIVAGSNETYGATDAGDVSFGGFADAPQPKATRVYAISGKTGAILPGWPVPIVGIIPDVLPLIGPGADPALVKAAGAQRIVTSATSGPLATYGPDGTNGPPVPMDQEDSSKGNATDKSAALNLFESAAIGKLLPAGNPSVVKYEVSLSQAANLLAVGQNFPYNHLIGAWDAASGAAQPGFPTITDDYQFLSSSTIAKVAPSSPANQVLAGNGLGLLHAYDGATGQDVTGFPKTTGGWLFSPATLSDDGRMAGITREGYLFEWTSQAPACQTEWPSFRHDQQNSGNYDRDGTPPAAPGFASLTADGGSAGTLAFKVPGDDGFCGTATKYVAKVDGQPVDLGLGNPTAGGSAAVKKITLPAGALLSLQAVDDEGNLGAPVELGIPAPPGGGNQQPGGGNQQPGGGNQQPGGGNQQPGGPKQCSTGRKLPRSSISGRNLRASKRHIHLSGRSREVDCKTGRLAVGKVKRVLVSIARIAGRGRCRFVRGNGRLGSTRACNKPQYLTARILKKRGERDKTLWDLNRRVRLPAGRYVVTVRGVDAAGHRETQSRSTNTKTFRLR